MPTDLDAKKKEHWVTCPDGTTDIANGIAPPCIGKQKLPTKPVSKNLTPYIYVGIGIVATLIVARIIVGIADFYINYEKK